jgi:hypothetical protein
MKLKNTITYTVPYRDRFSAQNPTQREPLGRCSGPTPKVELPCLAANVSLGYLVRSVIA